MGGRGYRRTADGRVELVADDSARELGPAHADAREKALAVLREAERARLGKGRPEMIAQALADAYRAVLQDWRPGEVIHERDVLAWIDGPGLDVILETCMAPRPAPAVPDAPSGIRALRRR